MISLSHRQNRQHVVTWQKTTATMEPSHAQTLSTTRLTQNRPTHENQREHGFHGDLLLTVHINRLEFHFRRNPEIQRGALVAVKGPSLGCTEYGHAPNTRCCLTVPESDRLQQKSCSTEIDHPCTSSNAHRLHNWKSHCLSLSPSDIHEQSVHNLIKIVVLAVSGLTACAEYPFARVCHVAKFHQKGRRSPSSDTARQAAASTERPDPPHTAEGPPQVRRDDRAHPSWRAHLHPSSARLTCH